MRNEYNRCNRCCDCAFCNSKYQIIKSIALQEVGIANILKAEGDKIQKSVENFESIDKLIAVNESVIHSIIHLTQLETQMYLKLESIHKKHICTSCSKEK